jgi:uncharacterized protein (UPF0262 family)
MVDLKSIQFFARIVNNLGKKCESFYEATCSSRFKKYERIFMEPKK